MPFPRVIEPAGLVQYFNVNPRQSVYVTKLNLRHQLLVKPILAYRSDPQSFRETDKER